MKARPIILRRDIEVQYFHCLDDDTIYLRNTGKRTFILYIGELENLCWKQYGYISTQDLKMSNWKLLTAFEFKKNFPKLPL